MYIGMYSTLKRRTYMSIDREVLHSVGGVARLWNYEHSCNLLFHQIPLRPLGQGLISTLDYLSAGLISRRN